MLLMVITAFLIPDFTALELIVAPEMVSTASTSVLSLLAKFTRYPTSVALVPTEGVSEVARQETLSILPSILQPMISEISPLNPTGETSA